MLNKERVEGLGKILILIPSQYLKKWVSGFMNKIAVSNAFDKYHGNHPNIYSNNEPSAKQITLSPKQSLIRILQMPYSGELGAVFAYQGHRKSVADPTEKQEIQKIEGEELEHRKRVGEMLSDLGSLPDSKMELQNHIIGETIGMLCRIGGWFIPMYGAGKLESQNTGEYEDAARYAVQSGHLELLDDLLTMAEVEWDHEEYFRDKCRTHFLYQFVPKWKPSPKRESIRQAFASLLYPEGHLCHEVSKSHCPTIVGEWAYSN